MSHTFPARHRARRALFALAVGMLLGPAGPWSAGLCLALEVPERKSALASTTAAGSPGDAARDSARTAAVQAARQGRLEPALQALRELAATSSDARVHQAAGIQNDLGLAVEVFQSGRGKFHGFGRFRLVEYYFSILSF
jgi:hypothetical protein